MDGFLDGIDGGLILMLLVYSGLASWIVARLTRSVSDDAASSREALSESLDLLDRLKRADELVSDPTRRRELNVMYARVEDEVGARVAELNGFAQRLHERPSARFVVLPRPRRITGAVLSLLLVFCFYVGGGLLLEVVRQFVIDQRAEEAADGVLSQIMLLAGGGVGLIVLGFVFRVLAYRDYDAHVSALRDQGRQPDVAAPEGG